MTKDFRSLTARAQGQNSAAALHRNKIVCEGRPVRESAVVIMAGQRPMWRTTEDITLAKDAGMDEHLAKPVDMRKMLQTMSRLRRRANHEAEGPTT